MKASGTDRFSDMVLGSLPGCLRDWYREVKLVSRRSLSSCSCTSWFSLSCRVEVRWGRAGLSAHRLKSSYQVSCKM